MENKFRPINDFSQSISHFCKTGRLLQSNNPGVTAKHGHIIFKNKKHAYILFTNFIDISWSLFSGKNPFLQGVSQYFGHLATYNFSASEASRIKKLGIFGKPGQF